MKASATEEKRIQQQILVQQKKELTTFLDTQKKQYRMCRDRMKEVSGVQISAPTAFCIMIFNYEKAFKNIQCLLSVESCPLNITFIIKV